MCAVSGITISDIIQMSRINQSRLKFYNIQLKGSAFSNGIPFLYDDLKIECKYLVVSRAVWIIMKWDLFFIE